MSTQNDSNSNRASSAGASFAALPEELLVQIFNHLDVCSTVSEGGAGHVSIDPRSFSLTNQACYRASQSSDGATILIKDPMRAFFKLYIADFDGYERRAQTDQWESDMLSLRDEYGEDRIYSQPDICSRITADELRNRYRQTAASRAQTWVIPDTGYGYQTYRCLDFLKYALRSNMLIRSHLPEHLVLNFCKLTSPDTEQGVTGTYEAKILQSAIELGRLKRELSIHYYPPACRLQPAWLDPSGPATHLSIHGTAAQIPAVEYYRVPEKNWYSSPSISYHCQLPRLRSAGSDPTDTGVNPAQAAKDLVTTLKDRASQPSDGRRTKILCKIPIVDSVESRAFKEAFEANKDGLDEIMREANFEVSWNVKKAV